MKESVKWILIALLLVGIIAGSTVLYNRLGDDYKGGNIKENSSIDDSEADYSTTTPDFTVLDYEGNEVNLSDYKGKPIVLNFWATWCYYCKEEMPDFNKAFKEYPEVQFMMVNATDGLRETMESAKQYVEKEKFEFDVFFDVYMEAVNDYYVTAYPSTFFIDAKGNLVTKASGMLDYEGLISGIEQITK